MTARLDAAWALMSSPFVVIIVALIVLAGIAELCFGRRFR